MAQGDLLRVKCELHFGKLVPDNGRRNLAQGRGRRRRSRWRWWRRGWLDPFYPGTLTGPGSQVGGHSDGSRKPSCSKVSVSDPISEPLALIEGPCQATGKAFCNCQVAAGRSGFW